MTGECKAYLIVKLQSAGIKSKVHTSMKKLRASQESHIGAVLLDGDTFTRCGAKKIYRNEAGDKHKRKKVFDRQTSFMVVIGEYEEEKCEKILEVFMTSLDKGIYIDGNYTAIEVEEADWVDEEDSILKAKIAVQVKVKFNGGIYRDTDFAKVNEYEVESIEKETGYGSHSES